LSTLPLTTHQGRIIVIEDSNQEQEALNELSRHSIVGFDTETRPAFHKGRINSVALIQISTGETPYLFRINKFGLTPHMIDFFENQSITKVGLSIKDDFFMLRKIADMHPQSCVELQDMVKDFEITDSSLQKIYGILFGERISKGQRLSNWEAAQLTDAQCKYAAIDAWACLRIYHTLSEGRFVPAMSPYRHPVETPDAE
ncbi:MAG: 3'-5' exonuclease domain-containing protein 2, partial [Muribaculum sp.]|nr:3'-5' exonuclease domain-containing protein 2 [Muribaculum sp.]